MISLYIFLFIISACVLFYSSSRVVDILMGIAKFLGLREFVLGFFIMAFASSLPNLFTGINSALQGIPQLSFGDIIGGNVIDLTLVVALAVLFSSQALPAESRMVQKSAMFCGAIAVLPLFLVFDGTLSRADGVILILSFFVYAGWLFARSDRFKKNYKNITKSEKKQLNLRHFFINILKLSFFLIILFFATNFMVKSVKEFSGIFSMSLPLLGILIVGASNCLPETYFSIVSARKGQNWMILGDLMGSVIVCATLVLGIVAIISPIHTDSFYPFLVARIFVIMASVFFYIAVRTGQKITKLEALFLLFIFAFFVLAEIRLIDFSGLFNIIQSWN